MISSGFIILHRKIFNNPLWKERPFDQARAFVDLLLLAAFLEHEVNGRTVKRGQLLTTLRFLSERWGWHRDSVHRFLRAKQNAQMMRIETSRRRDTGGTLITIINYEKYQALEETGDDEVAGNCETRTTESANQSAKQTRTIITRVITREQNTLPFLPEVGTSKPQPKARKKAKGGPNVWGEWIDLHRERGLPDPTAVGTNTRAGSEIGAAIPDATERKRVLAAYLDDPDEWLVRQGHALSLLPKRIDGYRNQSEPTTLDEIYDDAANRIVRENRRRRAQEAQGAAGA